MEYATLQNGLKMPMEGFGVFQVRDKEECKRSVLDAIRTGYRLIDTAASYTNEGAVGEAVREAIAREDAKEAREMERMAKLRTENEKRERQLANASQHKVNSGDTLYSIAKTYDMSMSELLAANGLSDNNIKVGQTLVVGKAAERAIQTAKAKEQKQQQANMNYVVRKGDTLNSIAGKFNLKVNDLRKWNNGNNIRPGQKIQLRQL